MLIQSEGGFRDVGGVKQRRVQKRDGQMIGRNEVTGIMFV